MSGVKINPTTWALTKKIVAKARKFLGLIISRPEGRDNS